MSTFFYYLGQGAPTHINIVLNWFSELKRLAPVQ